MLRTSRIDSLGVYLLGFDILAPFVSLKKQAETLFPLICYERKIMFQLKRQTKKYGL